MLDYWNDISALPITLKSHSANEWYHAWHMIFPDSHFDDYMVFCDFLIKEIK